MNLANKLGFGPKREVTKGDGRYRISVTPPAFMGLPTRNVILTEDQYNRYLQWESGRQLMQDALPDLPKEQREILMSGIGPDDFDTLYPDDGEEDL